MLIPFPPPNLIIGASSVSKNEFIKEYFEQDNCGTAYPIYFVIRDVDWQASYHFEEGDRFIFVWDTYTHSEADTLKELFEKIREDEDITFPEDFDPDWLDEDTIEDIDKASGGHGLMAVYSQRKEYKEQNLFLLKSEAEEHLKANHYHYSKEAHVYCKHAWRAPRTEAFLNNLKEESK